MNTLTKTSLIALAMIFAINVTANADDDSKDKDFGIKGFGGKIQYVSPSNVDGTVGAAFFVDFGNFNENIKIYPTVSYWKGSLDFGLGSGILDLTQIGFQIDSRYYLDPEASMKFFVGGGSGVFIHTLSTPDGGLDAFGVGTTTADFGFNLFGGIEKGILFAEARYTLVSERNTFGISGGVNFTL